MCSRFRAVCEELGHLQVRMIRRDGNPTQLVAEAIELIRHNCDIIQPQEKNLPYVPLFLRSCGTLLSRANTDPAHEALECAARLAESYVDGNHGDVNESGTVLRSLVLLSRNRENSAKQSGYTTTPLFVSPIKPLVAASFNNTMQKWQKNQIRPHTSTLLSLLRGSDTVYGENFHFSPVSADITGLLPIKGKVQMEAKVQKCAHSRCILRALRDVQLSKLDAGICLSSMAEMGFYDAELCNACCEVLFSTHALVTSQQFAQIIYSLGILQHRHIHQKFFSSMVEFQKCNAEAVRQHVVGLAMLRQPPPNERSLMDGIFLHALRPTDPLEFNSSPDDALTPEWYLCVGHALACLDITHFKYRLMMARTLRRCIGNMTTQQRCKMLYSLGNIPLESVPEELKRSWTGKVVRTIGVLTERLRYDVDPSDGPFVMNTLLAVGVHEHPMIPQQPNLESGENPVEVLLRTWATSPKERVLHLTEQIRPRHLGGEPTATLSHLFTVIASSCGGSQIDSYRFSPLCDAVSSHVGDMNVEETLSTIAAMQCIGIGEQYRNVLVTLLENLWRRRGDMTPESQARCCRLMENLGHLDIAVELLEYMASV
ncbi:uncharacterized protein TM35_000342520 [Trypanosoma theileri]|uniref:Uncharacterized protein n=1 Tax=Trypanosoma theileri TaxID=67003 RepID=A0A1X0NNB6_9TRYP|nr:uncharacterized protein TM35_000342520 [Trypanosoma theileri]ORC85640.1 hypothetical protein TM35_000342520 [Trypanosoma theileri]